MNIFIAAAGVLLLATGLALGAYALLLGHSELLNYRPGELDSIGGPVGVLQLLNFKTNLSIFAAATFVSGAVLILAAQERRA